MSAYDPVLQLRNPTDSGNTQVIPEPSKTFPTLWAYDFSADPKVRFLAIGSNLSIGAGGTLDAASTPGPAGPQGPAGPTGPQGPAGAVPTRVFASPVRALNTAFQPNATRDAQAVYTVDISVTSLLLAGTSGRVVLEYADNAAMTTNLVTVCSAANATGGVLNVTNLGTAVLVGIIPAGKYARLRTVNVSGTPTYTFQSAQEVLL